MVLKPGHALEEPEELLKIPTLNLTGQMLVDHSGCFLGIRISIKVPKVILIVS